VPRAYNTTFVQVALKLLGQHAEPQHVNYLLSRAPRKSLGDLSLDQIITAIMGTDVRLALPLQTVEKLKEVSPGCLLSPPPRPDIGLTLALIVSADVRRV
jgi:hypothetical protein